MPTKTQFHLTVDNPPAPLALLLGAAAKLAGDELGLNVTTESTDDWRLDIDNLPGGQEVYSVYYGEQVVWAYVRGVDEGDPDQLLSLWRALADHMPLKDRGDG